MQIAANLFSRRSRHSTFLSGLCFFLVICAINLDIFRVPIIEDSDLAANSIQIQNAKHFTELLGNYSRWRFHHPGPGLFYIFAAGEFLFHDLLRWVPAPINGQILALLILNTCFLFGALAIFREHCCAPFFLPTAIAASILFIYTVNRTVTNGAFVSIWMPHVLLFCFLFFVTTAASVFAGRITHLPFMVAAGVLLIHGHVAQALFVVVLSTAAVLPLAIREWRAGNLWTVYSKHKVVIYASVAVVAMALLPIVLDIGLHEPDNLDDIRAYMRSHTGLQQTPMVSLKYFFTFLFFIGNPEVVLRNASARLLSRALSEPHVVIYWTGFLLLVIATTVCFWRRRTPVSLFNKFVFFELFLISALFLVWALKIGGELYNFNGFFLFSIQLLAWLNCLCLVTLHFKLNAPNRFINVVACLVPALMLLAPNYFRNTHRGNPQIETIVERIPSLSYPLFIGFQPDYWPVAAGVANRLKRKGKQFCVEPAWGFMFGSSNSCKNPLHFTRLQIESSSTRRQVTSQLLFESAEYSVYTLQPQFARLPLRIGVEDTLDFKSDFYAGEGTHRWSRKRSSIHFLLSPEISKASECKMTIQGGELPGRPVKVFVNGHAIGEITDSAAETVSYLFTCNQLRAGEENLLTFDVPAAAPVGADPRELGYSLRDVLIEEVVTRPGRRTK